MAYMLYPHTCVVHTVVYLYLTPTFCTLSLQYTVHTLCGVSVHATPVLYMLSMCSRSVVRSGEVLGLPQVLPDQGLHRQTPQATAVKVQEAGGLPCRGL